jgi:hypothetical protein
MDDEVTTTQQNDRNADEQEDRHGQSPFIGLAHQPFIAHAVPTKKDPVRVNNHALVAQNPRFWRRTNAAFMRTRP